MGGEFKGGELKGGVLGETQPCRIQMMGFNIQDHCSMVLMQSATVLEST